MKNKRSVTRRKSENTKNGKTRKKFRIERADISLSECKLRHTIFFHRSVKFNRRKTVKETGI